MKERKGLMAIGIILMVILADQILKFWVKTHFYLGEEFEILPWFRIKFIENNGMAFGLELWSKYVLTFLRIGAVALLIRLLTKIRRWQELRTGFFVAMAMITAGAAGNIFDCVFYGEIFSNPYPPEVAQLFPEGGGYAGWFEGQVVDMLYFPLFAFNWPDWIPVIGGKHFSFFDYIFNVADAAICTGVMMLLLFYSRDFQLMMTRMAERLKRKKHTAAAS